MGMPSKMEQKHQLQLERLPLSLDTYDGSQSPNPASSNSSAVSSPASSVSHGYSPPPASLGSPMSSPQPSNLLVIPSSLLNDTATSKDKASSPKQSSKGGKATARKTSTARKACQLPSCSRKLGDCMHCTCDGSCGQHEGGLCGSRREGGGKACKIPECAKDETCMHSTRASCCRCRNLVFSLRHTKAKSRSSSRASAAKDSKPQQTMRGALSYIPTSSPSSGSVASRTAGTVTSRPSASGQRKQTPVLSSTHTSRPLSDHPRQGTAVPKISTPEVMKAAHASAANIRVVGKKHKLAPSSSASSIPLKGVDVSPLDAKKVKVSEDVPTTDVHTILSACSAWRDCKEPCDLFINVDGSSFTLHQSVILPACRTVADAFQNNPSDAKHLINIPAFPGGAEAFELAVTFCYDEKAVEITDDSVAPLYCAAHFLGMSYGEHSLVSSTTHFLDEAVFSSSAPGFSSSHSVQRVLWSAIQMGPIGGEPWLCLVERCVRIVVGEMSDLMEEIPTDIAGLSVEQFLQVIACARAMEVEERLISKFVALFAVAFLEKTFDTAFQKCSQLCLLLENIRNHVSVPQCVATTLLQVVCEFQRNCPAGHLDDFPRACSLATELAEAVMAEQVVHIDMLTACLCF